eukprot:scaffold228943_cov22-Prasinocladus_malaysianus.AAC.1
MPDQHDIMLSKSNDGAAHPWDCHISTIKLTTAGASYTVARLDEAEAFNASRREKIQTGRASREVNASLQWERVSSMYLYPRTPGFSQRHKTSISERIVASPHSDTLHPPGMKTP